jgi:hypothetical protein
MKNRVARGGRPAGLYAGDLGFPVFLFQEGDKIARLIGAPIAGSIQAQPGS